MVGNSHLLSNALKRFSSFWEKRLMIIIVAAVTILFFGMVLISCTLPTEPEREEEDKPVNQIASEMVHAVIEPDGTIWAWGYNYFGTLGNGTTENSDVPGKVLNIENAVALDLFHGIALAADQDGNIWFWGNYATHLEPPGLDTVITAPIKISYLQDAKSIHVFDQVVHLLKKDGTVWYMKLDHRSPSKFIEPEQVEGLENITRLSEYMVLDKDGSIFYLGNSAPDELDSISSLTGIKEIANVRARRTVILKEDGTVWAWGKNDFGQLGNGSYDDSKLPVKVSNLTDVAAISANYDYNLALKEDGTVWYWGLVRPNGAASIGQNIPVKIENLDDVELIYADVYSIVRKNDGTYWVFFCEDRIPEQVQF
ncbi:MAG: RCC1 domain-containing protein [Candidatus Neomarinimicrobiota bacterium]